MKFKRPDPVMLFSVIMACLIVMAAIVYVRLQQPLPAPEENPAALAAATLVTVPATLTTCSTDNTCLVVDRSCGYCCRFTAINAQHEDLFKQIFDQTCDPTAQGMCECGGPDGHPSCIQGQCQIVK